MTNRRGGSQADGRGLRVVVVDDDPTARRVICGELSRAGIVVLGVGAGGREAIELGTTLRPDILLMDVVTPDLDGIAATRRLAVLAPEVKVVILSVAGDEELGLVALESGAVGFLNKELDLGNLARILSGVQKGEAAFSRHLLRRLVERLQSLPDPGIQPPALARSGLAPPPAGQPASPLSGRSG
jgi:DNA-binding NarL/FixJ family response regulator